MLSSSVSQLSQAGGEAGVQVKLFLQLEVSVPAVPVRRGGLRVALLLLLRLRLRLRPSVEAVLALLCGGHLVENVCVKLVGQLASDFDDLAGAAVVP